MPKPTVAVVVTNYNYGEYIGDCLDSVLNLNYDPKHYDVIVVDDCSTDNSSDIIEDYLSRHENIVSITAKQNGGVAAAANLALSKDYDYYIRVDADDTVHPDYISHLVEFLQTFYHYNCVACDYSILSPDSTQKIDVSAKINNISCGIMYRMDKLIDWGGYNENFRHREEEELRKRVGKEYKIAYLGKVLYYYRMHASNKTKDPEYKKTVV